MNAKEAIHRYQPRPSVASVCADEDSPEAAWWIELSAESTIVELALLTHVLAIRLRAHHMGEGVFRLYPVETGVPRPTTLQLHDILVRDHDPKRLPMVLARQWS